MVTLINSFSLQCTSRVETPNFNPIVCDSFSCGVNIKAISFEKKDIANQFDVIPSGYGVGIDPVDISCEIVRHRLF